MKRFLPKIFVFILLFSFGITSIRAQDGLKSLKEYTTPVRSIDPADIDFSDLEGLKTAIGDSRIVLLGEQTHGEGSTFLAKTRIIKFLHEKLGFDVLAFESGFYDCARIWANTTSGSRLSDEVIGSLFYMYATSKQTQALFDYIQSGLRQDHSLIVAGFESQHSGLKAKKDLFADFERFLKQKDAGMIDSAWELFKHVSVATFASRDYRPAEGQKKIFFHKLQSLKQALGDDKEVADSLMGSAGFWYRVVCSIESQTLRYWQMTQGNEVSIRDLQMANNLIWLAEKAYPGKKIIVWAHNGHIAKSVRSPLGALSRPVSEPASGKMSENPDAFVPMGVTIHKYFGARAYGIGFSGSEGSYMDYEDGHIISVAGRSANSIEGILAGTGYANAFINYRHAPVALQLKQQASLANYMDQEGIWPDTFDGLFYIKKVFPVVRTAK